MRACFEARCFLPGRRLPLVTAVSAGSEEEPELDGDNSEEEDTSEVEEEDDVVDDDVAELSSSPSDFL